MLELDRAIVYCSVCVQQLTYAHAIVFSFFMALVQVMQKHVVFFSPVITIATILEMRVLFRQQTY